MTDKGGVAASQDYGKDEASVEKLLTKHNALETDVLAHSGIIQGLAEDARRLVQSGHFDGAKIAARQVSFLLVLDKEIVSFYILLAQLEVTCKLIVLILCKTLVVVGYHQLFVCCDRPGEGSL